MNKIDIFLQLTTICNYRCIFCYDLKKLNGSRTLINLQDIKGIDKLLEHAKSIDITGTGEILTHPNFFEILNYITQKNVPIRFVTNGYLLDEKHQEAICKSSASEIVISLNSLNRDIYKKLMGVDGLETVLKNLKTFNAIWKKTLQISFVINNYNFNEIPDFINLGKQINRHIACIGLTPTLKYPSDLIISDTEENRNKIKQWKEYATQMGVSFYIFNFETQTGSLERDNDLSKKIKNCNWVDNTMFIGQQGEVVPCCWSKMLMGNILQQSFEEIWYGPKYTELRNLIKNGDTKYCQNCRKDG